MVSPYKLECPVCEHKNEVAWGTEAGTRLTCESCSAQLQVAYRRGKPELRCAFCDRLGMPCVGRDCEKVKVQHQRDLLLGEED